MSIYRATTPTITFNFPEDVRLADVDSMVLSFAQNHRVLVNMTKNDVDIDTENNCVVATLTQEQTALFLPDLKINMQFRVKMGEDVIASNIMKVDSCRVLNAEAL